MSEKVKKAESFYERIAIAKAAREAGRRFRVAEAQRRAKRPWRCR